MMICKKCGKETSNVFCDNCGINVVWYNKYGILQNIDNSDEINELNTTILNDSSIEDALDIFIPDGSGD